MNFVFLFASIYAFLDWAYDSSPLKVAKLVLAILAAPPAIYIIMELLTMVKNYENFTKIQYLVGLIPLEERYKIGNGVFEDYFSLQHYRLLKVFMGTYNGKCEIIKNKEMYINYLINNEDHFIKEETYKGFMIEYSEWDGKTEVMAEISTKGTTVQFYPDGSQNIFYNITNIGIDYNKLYLGASRIDNAFTTRVLNLKNTFFKDILYMMNPNEIYSKYEVVYSVTEENTDIHVHSLKETNDLAISHDCKRHIDDSPDNFLLEPKYFNLIVICKNKKTIMKNSLVV
ncbi:unnamed protein product [Cunninghamella blakesleeana]